MKKLRIDTMIFRIANLAGRRWVLIFVFLFVSNSVLFCQSKEWIEYLALRDVADSLYKAKKYDEAKLFFDKMVLLKKKFCYEYDLCRYIYCLVYVRDTVEVEPYLLELVQTNWFEHRYITDFLYESLHTQPYWHKIDSIAKINGNKNYTMMDSLAKMAKMDTEVRTIDSLRYLMFSVDLMNMKKLKDLIALYGFPTWRLVGRTGAGDAWQIVQHAPSLEFQEWYLEQYEQAVKEDNAFIRYGAFLLDRVRLGKKIPQLYGTQWYTEDFFQPIEDVEHLNDRRETVLLRPVDISKMNIADEFPH